jgi:putative ABC transport system permease protein
MTWLREILRSKLKFGLLAAAVGLLFFLLIFVNTLSSTLLDQFVGAIENSSADVLVFDSEAQATIPASRLTDDDVARVAEVDGVETATPISELTTDTTLDGTELDVSLWGLQIGGPGTPTELAEGRFHRRFLVRCRWSVTRGRRRGGERHLLGPSHRLCRERDLE